MILEKIMYDNVSISPDLVSGKMKNNKKAEQING